MRTCSVPVELTKRTMNTLCMYVYCPMRCVNTKPQLQVCARKKTFCFTLLQGRLCRLFKWPDFPGYGFNLHAEKGKPGQYIGVVDSGSPAEATGLHEGDRIVGVNGEDVIGRSHQDVVASIKSDPHRVALLVIDSETERSMLAAGVQLSLQTIESVETFTCPDTNPNVATLPAVGETSGIYT